ncbi:hypothetical protein AAC387_Pa10g1821 [Persea americana]
MVALSFIVGIVGNFVSVLIFFSPIPTFYRIVKRRSTEEFSGLPYVCTLLQTSLWVYYGFTKPGAILVATVNIVGTAMEIIFVALFLIYASSPRKRVTTALLVALLDVGFLGVAVLVTHFAMNGDVRINVIGCLCAGLCIIMYASPLSIMMMVITTKSVEFMPFLLSLILFCSAAVWTVYSVLTKDLFLGVPNGVGFLLGTAQLILYAIYSDSRGAKSKVQGLEDGTQPLIQPVEVHENDVGVKNKIESSNNTDTCIHVGH